MDNQHKQITGYRDLSQEEIDLMNEIKVKANEVGELIERLAAKHKGEWAAGGIGKPPMAEWEANIPHVIEAARWTGIAKTHLQQGFMALTRAVARPTSF